MAQAGFTPIALYNSSTPTNVPLAGNLVAGELALNTADGKLYYEDSGGTVKLLASNAGSAGDVVGPASSTDNAVARFDGTTGKAVQNSVVIIADTTGNMSGVGTLSSGAITSSSLTSGRVPFAGTAGLIQDDADLTFNGTILTSAGFAGPLNGTVGATTPATGSFTNITGSANAIISVTDNTNAALRITQLGTGDALLVEDTTNPDATPVVINSVGATILGYTATIATQNYAGTALANTQFQLHGVASSTSAAAAFNWASSTASPASFIFNKSISNTVGTRGAITATGTDLGALSFNGDDGTNFIPGASILAETDGTPGVNDMPGRLIFSTTADGAATSTERMRIDSAGLVSVTGTISSTGGVTVRNVSVASASPILPTSNTADQYNVTALAAGVTVSAPSGTPTNGQKLTLRIKDNGTAQTLTWTTTSGGYRVIGTTLPLTTVISKTLYVGLIYNSTDVFWDVVAVAQQV
jgi:hypothetical protein